MSHKRPPKWVKDNQRRQCVRCATIFTFFRRQHHCRHCGEIFCDECSTQRLPHPSRPGVPVRICDMCFGKAKNSAMQANETSLLSHISSETKSSMVDHHSTKVVEKKREARVTSIKIVHWARGEAWKVPLEESVGVGETAQIGEIEDSAKIEMVVETAKGGRANASCLLSELKRKGGDTVLTLLAASRPCGSLTVRMVSKEATSRYGQLGRRACVSIFVLFVVLPSWAFFALILWTRGLDELCVVEEKADEARIAEPPMPSTLERFAYLARRDVSNDSFLSLESLACVGAILSSICAYLILILVTPRTRGPSWNLVVVRADSFLSASGAPSTSETPSASKDCEREATTLQNDPSSSHPPRVQEAVRCAVENVQAMAGYGNFSEYCKWKPNGGKGDVRYYISETVNGTDGGLAIKAVLPYVPVPPSAIVSILTLPYDNPQKRRLNPDTDSVTVLKRLDNRTTLIHQRNKGLWPTTPREMVMVVHVRKFANGNILLCVRSIDTSFAPSENPNKFVRMQVFSAGWVLEPLLNDSRGSGTKATYVNHFDPMGSIPKWVVKKGTTINLSQILRLQSMLQENINVYRRKPPMTNEGYEIYAPLAPKTKMAIATKNSSASGGSGVEVKEDDDEDRVESKKSSESASKIQQNAMLPPDVANVVRSAVDSIMTMAGAKGTPYCKWSSFGCNGDVKYFMAEALHKEGVAIKGILPFIPVCPAAIVTLLRLPLDDDRKRRLSPDVDMSKTILRYDNHTSLNHQRNKAIWPTAPREMVMIMHIRKLENGNVVVAAKSIQSSAAPPVDSKWVRMHVESAGYLLEPVKDKMTGRCGTRATYVNHFDPLGGIPMWVVKKGSSKNLSQVATLRDLIMERVDEYGKISPLRNETFEICPELAGSNVEEISERKVEGVRIGRGEREEGEKASSRDREKTACLGNSTATSTSGRIIGNLKDLKVSQIRHVGEMKKSGDNSVAESKNATSSSGVYGSPPRSSFRHHSARQSKGGLSEVSATCCGGWIGSPLGSPMKDRERG